MKLTDSFSQSLADAVIGMGAFKAAVIPVTDVRLEAAFRDICASNACGMYGRCWTCPPDCGPIDELMARVRSYRYMLVYQTVGQLEDSYDFEGMTEAGDRHNLLVQQVRDTWPAGGKLARTLHLGAGGCRNCARCAKLDGEPCRFPKKAIVSLEAHGIHVSDLAKAADMKYINGQDTVTYFGAMLFDVQE